MRFVGDGAVWTRAPCREFIERNERDLAESGFCQWAVEIRETAELIGFCGLVPRGVDLEIGWRIGKPFQQRGFGLEAARAVVQSKDAARRNLFATIQVENQPSIRLAEQVGMRLANSFSQNGRKLLRYRLEFPRNEIPKGETH